MAHCMAAAKLQKLRFKVWVGSHVRPRHLTVCRVGYFGVAYVVDKHLHRHTLNRTFSIGTFCTSVSFVLPEW